MTQFVGFTGKNETFFNSATYFNYNRTQLKYSQKE